MSEKPGKHFFKTPVDPVDAPCTVSCKKFVDQSKFILRSASTSSNHVAAPPVFASGVLILRHCDFDSLCISVSQFPFPY